MTSRLDEKYFNIQDLFISISWLEYYENLFTATHSSCSNAKKKITNNSERVGDSIVTEF